MLASANHGRVDAAALERGLRRLPGVVTARVLGDEIPLGVTVVASGSVPPSRLRRDVRSVAAVDYGVDLDLDRIVVVGAGNGTRQHTPRPADEPASPATPDSVAPDPVPPPDPVRPPASGRSRSGPSNAALDDGGLAERAAAARARLEAEHELSSSRLDAEQLLGRARLEAEQLLGRARLEAEQLLGRARLEAEQLLGRARLEAEQLLGRARLEAEGSVTVAGPPSSVVGTDVRDAGRMEADPSGPTGRADPGEPRSPLEH
jgi:hypothetical protein